MEFMTRVDIKEAYRHRDTAELTQLLHTEKTDVRALRNLLSATEKANDISPDAKEFRLPRIQTAIASTEERIEILEELLHENK